MIIVKVGFTATQKGLTAFQKQKVRDRLRGLRPSCVIHGGCVGGDDEFDAIAAEEGIDRYVFPSTIKAKRVPDEVLLARAGSKVTIMPAKEPLKRNVNIIDASDILIGCPGTKEEVLRSGTWSTIRHARRQKHRLEVIYP